MMAKQGPETKRVAEMRKAARAQYGERLVDIKYSGMYGETGVSDLLHCLDGVFVAVEVKHEKSHGNNVERALEKGPTVKQRLFVGHVLKAGGCAGFAVTVEQYLEILAHAMERADQAAEDRGWLAPCAGHNV